jgi:very-short-patch-repair endonuclease
MTKAEAVLWKKLRDRKIFNTKFRRQHPVYIFIVDFYCHEYKLVIEVDGDIHSDEAARQYDLGRKAVLNRFGLKVLRFTNNQILYSLDSVIETIHEEITEQTPL